MQSKLLIPIALGFSMVTVSALVVYYIFKKDEEEEDNKRVKTSRVNVIEVSVPKSIVPALIGRGGSNIKEIEKTTGAKVNVKEFTDKDYDVCVIRGRSDATQIAETLIHDFINQQPVNVEESMSVPAWACGRIIGVQGENINSISHRSGAKIKVITHNDKGTERKVTFLGTKEQIKIAKGLIENCVAQEKCRREIEQSKRSPRHVQSSSKSPSPTPSVTTSDNTEDASGDSNVQRHVKYKRPALKNGGANATRRSSRLGYPSLIRAIQNGSERVQQRPAEERITSEQRNETAKSGSVSIREVFILNNCYAYGFSLSCRIPARQEAAVEPVEEITGTTRKVPKRANLRVPKQPRPALTRADKGEVSQPWLKLPVCVSDHFDNAFLEYLAIVKATKLVNLMQCHEILQAFQRNDERLLHVLLEEAEAAVYNNVTLRVLRGEMTGTYMAAYSATGGFVPNDEDKSIRLCKITFAAPKNDPIVVTAKCTKIMLDDKILTMAQTIQGTSVLFDVQHWPVPKIKWINGVPGCGKTTWVVNHFDEEKDVVATTTIEAAKDLKEKLVRRIGDRVRNRVRTMASILANGFKEKYFRLTVDEALMNHFGSVVMAARLAGASEIVLIGDVNQLPFLDRKNLFRLWYSRPNLVASITHELLCTHRNPMDVAFALSDIYSGIYSSKQKVHSLEVKSYTGALIPKRSTNTLYLVHTQKEKALLTSQEYGEGEGSRILTIHEAQGLTCKSVVIINTRSKRIQLHDSMPHAVVAVSRHTVSCVYYTDHADDAIARFARRAMEAPSITIIDYNLKMALQQRDQAVAKALLKIAKSVTDKQENILTYFLNIVFFKVGRIMYFILNLFLIEEE